MQHEFDQYQTPQVDNPREGFPEIRATNLHGLQGSAKLRLSEPLFLEKLTVGESQRISFRCVSCNLEWPAQVTQCKLCGEKERTAQFSVASIFTNHGDSRARVWLNATLSRAVFRLSLEDLLTKINVSKGLSFLEDEARNLSTLTFRLIFSHREGDVDREGNLILTVDQVYAEKDTPSFLSVGENEDCRDSAPPRRRRKL